MIGKDQLVLHNVSPMNSNIKNYFVMIFLVLAVSCTDQGDPTYYAIRNATNLQIEVIVFERFGNNDTARIAPNDYKIMSDERPPFIDGPFGSHDSIRIQFEDAKKLTYGYLYSYSTASCPDSIKSPFCGFSSYDCSDEFCAFDVDSIEYQKAK